MNKKLSVQPLNLMMRYAFTFFCGFSVIKIVSNRTDTILWTSLVHHLNLWVHACINCFILHIFQIFLPWTLAKVAIVTQLSLRMSSKMVCVKTRRNLKRLSNSSLSMTASPSASPLLQKRKASRPCLSLLLWVELFRLPPQLFHYGIVDETLLS